jgi:hypothetical protein
VALLIHKEKKYQFDNIIKILLFDTFTTTKKRGAMVLMIQQEEKRIDGIKFNYIQILFLS